MFKQFYLICKYKLDLLKEVLSLLEFAFRTVNYLFHPLSNLLFFYCSNVSLNWLILNFQVGALGFATSAAFTPISLSDKPRTSIYTETTRELRRYRITFRKIDSSTAYISVLSEAYLGRCRFLAASHRCGFRGHFDCLSGLLGLEPFVGALLLLLPLQNVPHVVQNEGEKCLENYLLY